MPEPLPPYAQEWMAQWRYAAEELPKIRARELRALTDDKAIAALDILDERTNGELPGTHGLVIQQAWFVRMRILQLQESRR